MFPFSRRVLFVVALGSLLSLPMIAQDRPIGDGPTDDRPMQDRPMQDRSMNDQLNNSDVPANTVPQGTVFLIQLSDKLDTHTVKAGDHFQARLAEPITTADGQTLRPGEKIRGHVSAVIPGLQRRLLLSFDEIDTGHGWMPLIATVTGVPGEHGLKAVGDEGEIGHERLNKQQIAEAVVEGAGEGAEQGAHQGKRAAVVGAGNGAADGALTALEDNHELVLASGTALEIRLDRNLMIPPR
jgi:hypothetical protein